LLVDKPDGPTSHDVVARARRLFGTRAIGHTGTLDPFATGLLVLVFGGATRLARWAERHRKCYRATIRLGVTTTTDDRTGRVLVEQSPSTWPTLSALRDALGRLSGTQRQRPPAYSAKRVDGVRSHLLARRGETPAPAAADVIVYGLDVLDYEPPLVTLSAEVGPGTYIRALGRDLGELLGTGAHVAELRRERIGPWQVETAHRLHELTGQESLLPPRELVQDLPGIELSPEEVALVGHGRDVVREGPTAGEAALLDGERLVAVARAVPSGWHPAVVVQ
jgi:tRNA pseudouridine55 synthase